MHSERKVKAQYCINSSAQNDSTLIINVNLQQNYGHIYHKVNTDVNSEPVSESTVYLIVVQLWTMLSEMEIKIKDCSHVSVKLHYTRH